MRFGALVAVAALAAAAAAAQPEPPAIDGTGLDEWRYLTEGLDGSVWQIRLRDFLNESEMNPRVWIRIDRRDRPSADLAPTLRLVQFDCARHKAQILAIERPRGGGAEPADDAAAPPDMQAVTPGSLLAEALNFSCPRDYGYTP